MKITPWIILALSGSGLVGCAHHFDASACKGSPSCIERQLQQCRHLVEVRLDGATNPTVSEIFGKVLASAPSVSSARIYGSSMIANTPQDSWMIWGVELQKSDIFTLQTEMMDMFKIISSSPWALQLYGETYSYTEDETALLKGIYPTDSTSTMVRFLVDRELARDKEMASGRE